MTTDHRKRIVRKLMFWLGVVLLIVVGLGLLVLHGWRKAQGPLSVLLIYQTRNDD